MTKKDIVLLLYIHNHNNESIFCVQKQYEEKKTKALISSPAFIKKYAPGLFRTTTNNIMIENRRY